MLTASCAFIIYIWDRKLPDMVTPGAHWTDGISTVYTGTPPSGARYALNILFIGNSYTYFQNMPQILAELAAHDPSNVTELRVQSITKGGGDLEGLWKAGQAQQLIANARWQYVVLQDESFWAMFPSTVDRTYKTVALFDEQARKDGARSILFLTWARAPGSDWYSKNKFLRDADYMQATFTYQTHDLGYKLGIPVADVGEYWKLAHKQYPELALQGADNHHPNIAGAYLTALVFYSLFTGRDASQIHWAPAGVPDKVATQLRSLVSHPKNVR
jgi:hypothetical protein